MSCYNRHHGDCTESYSGTHSPFSFNQYVNQYIKYKPKINYKISCSRTRSSNVCSLFSFPLPPVLSITPPAYRREYLNSGHTPLKIMCNLILTQRYANKTVLSLVFVLQTVSNSFLRFFCCSSWWSVWFYLNYGC